ncbi:O-sialoglycoprotein endopeptidase [Chlamydia pneumoniae LPCoLN]|uniref:tRNA (adenosine(37)-N6)-threonylcarbamoyltransferase complex transferase subunit TsaD n=1 Tax=Chlamydia pneumoniae TaxID=83558 RepID=UPI0001BD9D2D|nr:tRNA (adenosine(37)-N6)-threonylcarbamoyltransferase complex transferase subunit TsaD [Chlamydia pneumoniae]ACZ33169.1 O-sialoglycoprotein endopeptidase [Chlamydia pneumoniae LPCoLN]ETR80073.1 YgjD/Kae1/Qri7 family [Chlamydia pneumoniae B21]
MLTLGLESSCDETACAIVNEDKQILANIIASQDIHASYGGVVPELASRAHLHIFPQVINKALQQANLLIEDMDLIAVTQTPGLIGSLSVGVHFGKGIAIGAKKPLIGVNHVEAHLYAAYMAAQNVQFPALGLVVSGAHTAAFFIENPTSYKLIGKTRDDAIGETFDKVGRFLGLPYPAGPLIEKLALEGSEDSYPFSPAKVPNYDFSFSGLKTAVLYAIKGNNSSPRSPAPEISLEKQRDIAASFQKAACTTIAQKLPTIIKEFSCRSILIGGGVAINEYFRSAIQTACNLPVYFPPAKLCSDNAAMIAGLGGENFQKNSIIPEIRICARYQWESVSPFSLASP